MIDNKEFNDYRYSDTGKTEFQEFASSLAKLIEGADPAFRVGEIDGNGSNIIIPVDVVYEDDDIDFEETEYDLLTAEIEADPIFEYLFANGVDDQVVQSAFQQWVNKSGFDPSIDYGSDFDLADYDDDEGTLRRLKDSSWGADYGEFLYDSAKEREILGW